MALQENSYDALIVVSFGGPENVDQIYDFLERINKSKNIPPERLKEVAGRYFASGGSPANKNNRKLIKQINKKLASADIDIPTYLGNRNSPPLLENTLKQMLEDGVSRALAFITSPFASYSSCRQYQEDLEEASSKLKSNIEIHRLRHFYNHPTFIQIHADAIASGLKSLKKYENPHILFSSHSLPLTMASGCDYVLQIQNSCSLIMNLLDDLAPNLAPKWRVVYQSISGAPSNWLGPDINEAISDAAADGADAILTSPLGFLSPHMEVLYDLDQMAKETAKQAGLGWVRVGTPQDDPRFASLILELIQERTHGVTPRALGLNPLPPDFCAPDCCPKSSELKASQSPQIL